MTAPIAPSAAPVAGVPAAPAAPIPVAAPPVAAVPAAPPAAAIPAAAPVAAAPVAATAVPTAAPVGLPAGYAGVSAVAPNIGVIPNSGGGGIPDEHFNKPILFRLLGIGPRNSKYEKDQVIAPTVDYIVLDPVTGQFTEAKNITIMQKNIRNELVTCFQRGEQAVTGVAIKVPTSNDNDAKVLRALDDQNSGYGAAGYSVEQVIGFLREAAISQFQWWTTTAA
ncbi:hypothetical protein [Mycobacteroides abscessus]|uniref:hypothetical protein n=1 Tax=Mycobacteroides abscessus TaxID=36809 RepID=UPI0005DBA090|nr:hypothetical protein [Mycobacteroides abscessus]CPW92531.1 Uncharacterised protein [Mycobacteroides abscessus]SKF41699.1 Uncharacterised protein [Mycobacteroides abscessus subsp. bolletii]SKH18373.1 Uncharacterised protein [Mycobacteroides abscessus subsp. bolletii]